MHVDVDAMRVGEFEDAADLGGGVGVEGGGGADETGATAQRFEEEGFGAGAVGEAFLGEDADFDVDGPGIVAREVLHGIQAAQADQGIDLDMGAHAGGAVFDAAFKGLTGAGEDVFGSETVFDGGNALHRHGVAALFGGAAVDDAGFFEMDVGFAQAGADEAALGIVRLGGIGHEVGADDSDFAGFDPDIDGLVGRVREAGVAEDEVHDGSGRWAPSLGLGGGVASRGR